MCIDCDDWKKARVPVFIFDEMCIAYEHMREIYATHVKEFVY